MIRKLLRPLCFTLGFIITASVVFSTITLATQDPYANAYQRAIVRQYDHFRQMGAEKLVFIGNSSLSYGLNLNQMEKLSGRPCAILGNHAGTGLPYFIELSKSNLQDGDIVVLEFADQTPDNIGTQLLFSGVGKRLDMIRFVSFSQMGELFKDYPEYLLKTLRHTRYGTFSATGSYSLASYDQRGNMIYPREKCNIPSPFTEEVAKTYKWKHYSAEYDKDFIQYLNSYNRWCISHRVTLLVTVSNFLDESVRSSPEEIKVADEALSDLLDAPLISNSSDYIYSRDYTYNAIAHCNTKGAEKRTAQIWDDMVKFGVQRIEK